MPANKSFFRESNIWRLLGGGSAIVAVFAPSEVALAYGGFSVTASGALGLAGVLVFLWPTVREIVPQAIQALREWRRP